MKQYRLNVGIVVFNSSGQTLMCARANEPGLEWQYPQGGIDQGEDIVTAARRELREETGLSNVSLVDCMEQPLRYDFPQPILEAFRRRGNPYSGQDQYWALFYFDGADSEIDFCTHPEEVEFKAYQWTDIARSPELIVDFKKEVYRQMAARFAPKIKAYLRKL